MTGDGFKRGSERGVALVVSLVFLLLMTLIGVSAMQNNVLQEKMVGNFRDRESAFQAAEAALRHAESEILQWPSSTFASWTGDGQLGSTNGLLGLEYDDTQVDYSAAGSIWNTAGAYRVYDDPDRSSSKDPKYVIKYQAQTGSKKLFKITAYAPGKAPGTAVVLRSYYERDN